MREILKNWIEENGVMRVWVAKQLNISRSTLSNYLNGTTQISSDLEKRIAEFLKSKGRL